MKAAPVTREEIERSAGPNLAKDRWYRPELRPIEIRGRPCLVKDYSRRPLPWRLTWGRFMVRREASIYAVLQGQPGIPRFLGLVSPDAFVMERVEGREAASFVKGAITPEFLDRLSDVIRGMHARGVIHGDLRQRRNILVSPDDRPYLIDFASGFRLPVGTALHRWLRRPDLSAVAKLRAKHAKATLTPEDLRLLEIERFRPFRRARLKRREKRGHQTPFPGSDSRGSGPASPGKGV